jgi:hypothetical protein
MHETGINFQFIKAENARFILADRYRRFVGTCCLHLQGKRGSFSLKWIQRWLTVIFTTLPPPQIQNNTSQIPFLLVSIRYHYPYSIYDITTPTVYTISLPLQYIRYHYPYSISDITTPTVYTISLPLQYIQYHYPYSIYDITTPTVYTISLPLQYRLHTQ